VRQNELWEFRKIDQTGVLVRTLSHIFLFMMVIIIIYLHFQTFFIYNISVGVCIILDTDVIGHVPGIDFSQSFLFYTIFFL
jgi:hypothetical protein